MNKSTCFSGCALAIVLISLSIAPAVADLALVWSDEFNGNSLDTNNWTAEVGNGCPSLCGWGNNELEYYRLQNVTVADGNLILTSKQEYYGGSSYTSGKVHTRGKQYFLYGRMEMRAKIPTGSGIWPAFWMMPQDDVYGGWASSGEIDIMEAANETNTISGTIHYGGSWPDNTYSGGSYSQGGANFADDFHTYAVEWEEEVIRWYVDDVLYSTKTSLQWYSNGAPSNPLAPFDQDFYIILNAAVGGNYTGCTEPSCITDDLPQEYLIDYVRVYQETSNIAPTVVITAPNEGAVFPVGDITIAAQAEDTDGVVTRVEFFSDGNYLGEDSSQPFSHVWTEAGDGCFSITAKAFDDGGSYASDTVEITVGSGCGQEPYLGSPFALPGTLEAENFDFGGQSVAYHDLYEGNNGNAYRTEEDVDIQICNDIGGGYNLGWILTSEWTEYTISVPADGEYPIDVRVASLSAGGTFHLEFNGVNKTGDVDVPSTGGWQTWTTVSTTATLSAGTQVMRFVNTREGYNLNSFEFLAPILSALPDALPAGYILHPAFPNPFNPSTTISFELPEPSSMRLAVYDVTGRLVRTLVGQTELNAGAHKVVWNGRNNSDRTVAAGVYFYRLDAGEFSGTNRITMVK